MKTVLITRPEKQAKKFQLLLKGIDTLSLPVIKISPIIPCEEHKAEIIEQIIDGSWSIFTSANAVSSVSNLYLTQAPVAAVGEETASELRDNNLYVSFVPKDKTARGLSEELFEKYSEELLEKPVLVFQGSSASNEICEYLAERGVKTKKYVVYDVQDVTSEEFGLLDVLQLINVLTEKEIVITFFSGRTVRNFDKLVPELFCLAKNSEKLQTMLKEAPVVVIGSKTREVAEELGFKNILEPETKQSESVVKMLKSMILPC